MNDMVERSDFQKRARYAWYLFRLKQPLLFSARLHWLLTWNLLLIICLQPVIVSPKQENVGIIGLTLTILLGLVWAFELAVAPRGALAFPAKGASLRKRVLALSCGVFWLGVSSAGWYCVWRASEPDFWHSFFRLAPGCVALLIAASLLCGRALYWLQLTLRKETFAAHFWLWVIIPASACISLVLYLWIIVWPGILFWLIAATILFLLDRKKSNEKPMSFDRAFGYLVLVTYGWLVCCAPVVYVARFGLDAALQANGAVQVFAGNALSVFVAALICLAALYLPMNWARRIAEAPSNA